MKAFAHYLNSSALHTLGARAISHTAAANPDVLLNNLNGWMEEGPDVERSSRLEAVRRIMRCQVSRDKRLELSHLTLSSLPEGLGEMQHLEHLDVLNVGLKSIPPEIGQLRRLKCLHLAGNDLTELPAEISQLKKLRKLFLNANQFNALPEWLGELERLELLHVPHNRLEVLPETLKHLRGLSDFDAHDNRLTSLPTWLHEMNLRYLDVASNPIADLGSFAAGAKAALNLVDSSPRRPPHAVLRLARPMISPEAVSTDDAAAVGPTGV